MTRTLPDPVTPSQFEAAYAWAQARADALADVRGAAATPCSEFDLTALTAHLLASLRRFADVVAVQPWDWTCDTAADGLGEIRPRAVQGWADVDPAQPLTLPIGTLPAAMASWVHLTELLVHGWDLARTAGDMTPIPEELAEPTRVFAEHLLQQVPRGTAFAEPVANAGTASDRLVALLGRDPSWAPR